MTNFRIIDTPQRSEEWLQARCGRLCASQASDMLATRKDKAESADRRKLRERLIVERLTGTPQADGYVSERMERGAELETDALALYEAQTGNLTTSVGFLEHVALMAGASPDGVVGDFEGIVELKAPDSKTHWGYLRAGGVPAEYVPQMTHLLWLTDAMWADFFSFDPRFKDPALRSFCVRLHREQVDLAAYDVKVRAFLEEVDREVSAAQGWRVLERTA